MKLDVFESIVHGFHEIRPISAVRVVQQFRMRAVLRVYCVGLGPRRRRKMMMEIEAAASRCGRLAERREHTSRRDRRRTDCGESREKFTTPQAHVHGGHPQLIVEAKVRAQSTGARWRESKVFNISSLKTFS